MPSSTSSSRRLVLALALIAPVCAAVLPMEAAIRSTEERFGQDAGLGVPRTEAQKFDRFLIAVSAGRRFDWFIVGDSQCEYGLKPDVIEAAAGLRQGSLYNFSFSGSSFLAGLEILHSLRARPQGIIVCASPAAFSETELARGESLIAHARSRLPNTVSPGTGNGAVQALREATERAVAGWIHALLRTTDPRYRRTPDDLAYALRNIWHLSADPRRLARFLEGGRAAMAPLAGGRYQIEFWRRGYLGLRMLVPWHTGEEFERIAVAPIKAFYAQAVYPSYRAQAPVLLPRAVSVLRAFRERGAAIVVLRMPQYKALREFEERETGFSKTLDSLARGAGALLLTDEVIFDADPTDASRFRDAAHLHDESADPVSHAVGRHVRGLVLRK